MNEEHLRETLERLEKRINTHSREIDKLKEDSAVLRTEIKNLCADLRTLTNTMKWFITAIVGAFISFFFYAIQSNLF